MANELKTKAELSEEILLRLFTSRQKEGGYKERITIASAVDAAAKQHISRRTITRAARNMGIKEIRRGAAPGLWAWPDSD